MAEVRFPLLNGGLNIQDLEHKIADNQSPDMLNMWCKNNVLSKRWGQAYVSLTLGGEALTLGAIKGISGEFNGYVCIHANTKLYKWNTVTDVCTELATVAATACTFFEFNGNLYHIDGSEIRAITSAWSIAAVTPYVPVTYINCAPDLSDSTANEDLNLLGAGFTVWYNGDGDKTEYHLPLTGLDATEIVVYVGGVLKTLTSDYTWVSATGVVTFGTAPALGTNNVKITAYKTVAANKAKIAGCTIGVPFGGESSSVSGGSRVFLMGNATYPRTYWYSDLGSSQSYGAAYFPETQFEELSSNGDAIKAAAKQAGNLIILKEHSLFKVGYVFDGETVYYPVVEFNSSIGCDIPKSVQLIDNNLVFANTSGGVFMIINTSNSAEENVRPISTNINGTSGKQGLLDEASLTAATSIDYDRKYWLQVNDNVYLWDYDLVPFTGSTQGARRLAWFKFDNISADYWHGDQNVLYYGTGTSIVKFKDALNDFDAAIPAYWKSKAIDFGAPNYLKRILRVFPSINVSTNASITVTVIDENKVTFFSKKLEIDSFSWSTFAWNTFTWDVSRFSKPYRLKTRVKKIVYCQVVIEGNELNRDCGITDIVISYIILSEVKR